MKFLSKVLPCIAILGILSGCATSDNKTPFGQAKTNFAQENYQAAFNNIQGPANAGNAEAEYALGYMYYYGKGTPINQEKGKEWILKAAQAGNKNAQEAYQMILAREQQVTPAATADTQQMPMMKTPSKTAMTSATHKMATIKHAVPAKKKKTTTKVHAKALLTKSSTTDSMAEKQLLAMNSKHYTLQLLAASNARDARAYITKHKLGSNAYYFHRKLKGKDLYTVVYGNYATRAAAHQAIKTLPKQVQVLNPWVISFSGIQKQIRETMG